MLALKINPRIPQLLGYAGLLPMLALLFGIWGWPQLTTQLTDAATLYVGVIFSFLGGLQWGLAVRGDMENPPDTNATLRLIVGVAPSLTTGCALLIPTCMEASASSPGYGCCWRLNGTGGTATNYPTGICLCESTSPLCSRDRWLPCYGLPADVDGLHTG